MAKKTASKGAKPEASAEGVNKSEFIRGVFAKNATASAKEVQEAWAAAGHKVPLGTPLIYLVKSKSGKPSGRRGRPRGDMKREEGGSGGVGNGREVYFQIEAELDKLVSRAPDSKIAEALRNARRRVSAKLV